MRVLPLLSCLLILLAGCELIDQRTVARWTGQAPPGGTAADAARADLPPLPYIVIRYDDPASDPGPILAHAAEDALQRKSDAQFDVITPVPTALALDEQNAYLRRGSADARVVADDLAMAGVDPAHIHLGLRGDSGRPEREVRVYVR